MHDKSNLVVWDLAIRLFHWSLVVCFAMAYLSAEDENPWHVYSGYTVLGLVVFRILWGFIGSTHARFGDFIQSPSTVLSYCKSLLSNQPHAYRGHNPLGGWMVLLMLLTLLVVTLSGIQALEAEEQTQQVASLNVISTALASETSDPENKDEDEAVWEEIHETATDFMLLLIVLHWLGVIVASRQHHQNLVKAMFTGKKDAK